MSLSDAIAKIEGFWRHPDFSAAGWNRYEAMKRALLENDAIERAEVAALKARTAMAWRRREDVGEYYEGDRFLVAIHIRSTAGGTERFYWDFACVRVGDYGNLLTADGDDWGWRFADVDFVIPITDLTPPGGEDAS